MSYLTELESRAVETIIDQSDDQLRYTVSQFTNSTDEFDFVEYFVVPQNRIAFPVKKDFFVMAVLVELAYRGL